MRLGKRVYSFIYLSVFFWWGSFHRCIFPFIRPNCHKFRKSNKFRRFNLLLFLFIVFLGVFGFGKQNQILCELPNILVGGSEGVGKGDIDVGGWKELKEWGFGKGSWVEMEEIERKKIGYRAWIPWNPRPWREPGNYFKYKFSKTFLRCACITF